MCITLGAAKLSNTIVYAAERTLQGRTVHVLGYQNKVENYESGMNAMILPIPAKSLTAENGVDLSQCKNVLKSYRDAIVPPQRSVTRSFSLNSTMLKSAEVSTFRTGSYTVVVANEPRVLPEVVQELYPNIRINQTLMDEYSRAYAGWRVAVCLFDRRMDSEPLMFWYESLYPGHLFVPTLDAHDGQAPKPLANLDHTVVFGAGMQGESVHWHRDGVPPDNISSLFADRVIGFTASGVQANGDYWLRTSHATSLRTTFAAGATLRLPAGVQP